MTVIELNEHIDQSYLTDRDHKKGRVMTVIELNIPINHIVHPSSRYVTINQSDVSNENVASCQ